MEEAGQSREEISIQTPSSFYFPSPEKKEPCFQGEAERKASKLFGNYSRDQPIFLQLKDYFWVKTPSAYELPYGTKGSEDLLLRVLAITSYSIPESIQSLKCRRCVVVGNGHRLRNSSLGDAINKYDVVIRLNNAPVAGYEGDVGSKTTMRLFYPESAHFNPRVENNPDTLLVLVAFKAMDFHWIETILSDKKRVRKGFWKQPPLIWDVNPRQVRILNPFFMEIAADKLLNLPMQQPRKIKQKPTTGLLAITLALHLCDLVHIAGFGYPDAHNRKQTIHYYEQITLKSMAVSGPCFRAVGRGWGHWVSESGARGPEVARGEELRGSELEPRPLDSQPESSVSGHMGPVFLVGASTGKGGPGSAGPWGAPEAPSWAREVPGSPSVCFLGCLHRGQATTSPKRPWPSSGCWRLEQSRTSPSSDLGRSYTQQSARSAT
uniref:CMP-N-acetylneuraminate-beta-galactosamide-alpha-2,3-sialyltransferase 4 n=1 Tax=Panthera leo TaxID=9689 RepID=A0A8C8X3M8_PANLE